MLKRHILSITSHFWQPSYRHVLAVYVRCVLQEFWTKGKVRVNWLGTETAQLPAGVARELYWGVRRVYGNGLNFRLIN
jgi:hypothetical protein